MDTVIHKDDDETYPSLNDADDEDGNDTLVKEDKDKGGKEDGKDVSKEKQPDGKEDGDEKQK